MKLDFPEIQYIARLSKSDNAIRQSDREANETIYWADPDFLNIITFPTVAGDLRTALQDADGLVLTSQLALKYFDRVDVVGRTLEIDRSHTMTVKAVLADLPTNTHFSFDILASGLASYSRLQGFDSQPQREDSFFVEALTYIKLTKGASIQSIQEGMHEFFLRHKRPVAENSFGFVFTFPLVPLADIHLWQGETLMKPRGDLQTIYNISLVGLLILAIAVINFVNLMTARATRRAKEVGVRKAMGGARRDLMLQFLGESLVYVILGTAVAIGLAMLLLPSLNGFLQRTIRFELWRDIILAASIGGVTIPLGLLAGFYPAFVLSAFRPATALNSRNLRFTRSSDVRQLLVMLQFATFVGLVIVTATIYQQTEFAVKERFQFDTENVLLVTTNCEDTLRDEIGKLSGVRGAACSSSFALDFESFRTELISPNGTKASISAKPIGADFFELYGINLVTGRFFSDERISDAFTPEDATAWRLPVVLNETAVRDLGFGSPQDAIGQIVSLPGIPAPGMTGRSEVIGVVRDFSLISVRQEIPPSFYLIHPAQFKFLNVKLENQYIPETLAAIERVWRQIGEPRPIDQQFLQERLQNQNLDIIRQSEVFGIFASVALFVTVLGLFGLTTFTAESRTKEIGIRKALGASRLDIYRLLLWKFAKPVIWANVIAWPVAGYFANRWLEGFAYRISLEPWVFIAASGLALVIAAFTVTSHALLVVRTQPAMTLRYE